MLPFPRCLRAAPCRAHREHAGERVELTLMTDHGSVTRGPPIALEEFRHHSIATRSMPHEQPTGLKDPCKLGDDARVVGRLEKKAKRCEQVDDGVEAARP